MKGYKAFNYDFTCRDFQYEVGKTYEIEGELELCKNGFHFCKNLEDVFRYYNFIPTTRVAEVDVLGDVINEGNKSCTDKIKIVRELSLSEQLEIMGISYDTYNINVHIHNILYSLESCSNRFYDSDAVGPLCCGLLVNPSKQHRIIYGRMAKDGFYLTLWNYKDNYIIINLNNKAEAKKQLVDYLSTINESENKIYFSILSRIYQELEVM